MLHDNTNSFLKIRKEVHFPDAFSLLVLSASGRGSAGETIVSHVITTRGNEKLREEHELAVQIVKSSCLFCGACYGLTPVNDSMFFYCRETKRHAAGQLIVIHFRFVLCKFDKAHGSKFVSDCFFFFF